MLNRIQEGTIIKKYISVIIMCFILLLSACVQSEEDTEEYFGIIGEGKSLGFEYTVFKEKDSFSWRIGYKRDRTTIIESNNNIDDLHLFMNAVGDSKINLATLIISLCYFLFVLAISFFLYKKYRKTLKESTFIIIVSSVIALFIAVDASFDLHIALQDAKLFYTRLTS